MTVTRFFSILLLCSALPSFGLNAKEVPASADHVLADGPYILRDGKRLQAQWICDDRVTTRNYRRASASIRSANRDCGYPHPLHVAALAEPAIAVLPAVPRIVAVSDIHGQYGLLLQLLRANHVIDQDDNWALGEDTLVIAGDVFDRGPQVTEAFWLLYTLQQQAAEAGGAVHFVLGNHETMVLYDDLRYVNPKYLRSAQLLGRSYPQLYGPDSVIGQWLRTRPVLLRIGDTLFLHGGISPEALPLALEQNTTNIAYQASLGRPKAEVKADPATAPLYDGKTSPIWYRGYFDGRLDTAGVQQVLDQLGLKRIVVGHTSMPHVSSFHGDRIIAIDSSIKNGENGELLFIEDGKLSRGLLDGSRVALAQGQIGLDD
ncbi:metallophosphoesterase [Stenotrophomonas sp.]|uniref:metallophosphoesterase n=1 Tax=Stenotrophomonas sp. TaxID=69392 RepID=UPI0028B01F80|nr:metallophosphoesterase [Stenotrophomonas sp.]